MVKVIVQVSMIRATETGPQEFAPGDTVEVPAEHVERLIQRRIVKMPEDKAAKK